MLNPNYMWTSLFDTFSTLDRSKWKVADNSPFYGGFENQNLGFLLCWKDSNATISVNNGDLLLSGIKYDNYTTTFNWFDNDTTVTTNFIAASMETYDYFHYGIFECSMTCEYKTGTFPAFWLYNDSQCRVSKRTEIDIMEFKYEDSSPEINHGFFYYPPDCADEEGYGDNQSVYNSGAHTYKCIYMPDKVEFYIDNHLRHFVNKNEVNQAWFPDMQHHIILSHQLWRYNPTPPYFGIQYPQTTRFHWVSAKTFFLAPEITVPSLICSTGTAVMDVDTRATNVTWSLTPAILFTGNKTGTGKTVSITSATGASGQGKITYTFKMPSNEIFTAEKTFWVGKPGTPVTSPSGYPTLQLSLGAYQPISLSQTPGFTGGTINWWSTGSISPVGSTNGTTCTFNAVSLGTGNFYVTDQNTCGTSPIGGGTVNVVSGGGGQLRLVLSPNPTSGETTLSIETTTPETTIDESAEWDLEIYDQVQTLKEKKTKLKGKEQKIQTAGWKEGVYFVRVKYKDEILTGQLVVKQ